MVLLLLSYGAGPSIATHTSRTPLNIQGRRGLKICWYHESSEGCFGGILCTFDDGKKILSKVIEKQ